MSKKYLSLDEAAAQIGITTTELNRLREKGSIRAFADRGTWKFKEEDVENLARSRQADSDPDVVMQPLDPSSTDSGSDLVFMDDEALEGQPTIIRKGSDPDSGSDSDVRLVFDDSTSDPDAPSASALEDSDSDVKLAGPAPSSKVGGSDSDVKLVAEPAKTVSTGSDSDVQLVSSDSSGEVQLAGSGSDVGSGVVVAGSKPTAGAENDSSVLASESGISLADGSDMQLAGDSGISLAEGSGVALASDSGISLEQPDDSGISLAEESSIVLSGDSGISLAPDAPVVKGGKGKGKGKVKSEDDLTETIPLMEMRADEDEDILDTQMEVPMMDDSTDEVGGSSGSTSVITLDDDEDEEYAVTSVQKKRPADDDELLSDDDAVIDDAEAVDVSDEIIGEDDELDEDVFGAEDEDFASDVEAGASSSELPIPTRGLAAPVQQEWGAGTFAGLVVSTILMICCGTVMFDLVRNMWHTDAARQNPIASMLLDLVKGM